ncbi:hypothetical protein [Microbispora rosea]|uniref:hypothetical protein n=1 Tax=Microbispora rosea TaxID=58117 RepID=UPI003446FD29
MSRYHQQYLFKVPNGYCGIGGTGVNAGDPSAWCPSCDGHLADGHAGDAELAFIWNSEMR